MSDRHLYWTYAHPADQPRGPELEPEARRKAAERNAAETAREEADRRDTVTAEEIEVRASDLWGGGVVRDRFGNVKRDANGEPISFDPGERLPDEIPAEQVGALFGIAPRVEPQGDDALSPEAIFAREARKRKSEQFAKHVRDRFDAALAKKQEANR